MLAVHLSIPNPSGSNEAQDWDAFALSPVAMSVLLAIVIVIGILPSPWTLREPSRYPDGAVAFMRLKRLHGNILNEDGWGGYLVWNTAPESRVFIDTRAELVYPDTLLRQYLAFASGSSAGEKLLDEYPHDMVLIRPQSGAYRIVSHAADWRLVYLDEVSALFVRSGSRAARQTAAPVFAKAPIYAFR